MKLEKAYDLCDTDQPKLTVVLIHGVATDARSFDGLIKYAKKTDLLQNVRLVALDLLGAGKSYASDDLEYNYDEQIAALKNSISELSADTPVVIVAHSMGTLIAARYTNLYPQDVQGLILVSPPAFTKAEMESPAFAAGMKEFAKLVSYKKPEIVKQKSFKNEVKLIISDLENYANFEKLSKPTYIIYGELDKIIASYNLPKLAKENSNLKITKTIGAHSVTPDKYDKIIDDIHKFYRKGDK